MMRAAAILSVSGLVLALSLLNWAQVFVAAMAAMLAATTASSGLAQTPGARETPPIQMQAPAKPMTPARLAWLQGRCSELVAYFDNYGVSQGEHSDGPRNHTRIGAVIECDRTQYQTGIDTMEALLKRKAFDVPKHGTPAVEPEDIAAPDANNPTRQQY